MYIDNVPPWVVLVWPRLAHQGLHYLPLITLCLILWMVSFIFYFWRMDGGESKTATQEGPTMPAGDQNQNKSKLKFGPAESNSKSSKFLVNFQQNVWIVLRRKPQEENLRRFWNQMGFPLNLTQLSIHIYHNIDMPPCIFFRKGALTSYDFYHCSLWEKYKVDTLKKPANIFISKCATHGL